jgi:hypothetical protein
MATEAPAAVAAIPTRTEEDQAFLFKRFPGYLLTERKGAAWSWVWKFGYDISRDGKDRAWVCLRYIQQRNRKPAAYNPRNLANVEIHLFNSHQLRDATGKRPPPSAVKLPPGLPTVGAVLELVVQYILGYNAGYAC